MDFFFLLPFQDGNWRVEWQMVEKPLENLSFSSVWIRIVLICQLGRLEVDGASCSDAIDTVRDGKRKENRREEYICQIGNDEKGGEKRRMAGLSNMMTVWSVSSIQSYLYSIGTRVGIILTLGLHCCPRRHSCPATRPGSRGFIQSDGRGWARLSWLDGAVYQDYSIQASKRALLNGCVCIHCSVILKRLDSSGKRFATASALGWLDLSASIDVDSLCPCKDRYIVAQLVI